MALTQMHPQNLQKLFFTLQLLPICSMYAMCDKNLGDNIDYAQREGYCLGEVVADTLHLLELHGGPDAFINIKYLVPVYELTLAC